MQFRWISDQSKVDRTTGRRPDLDRTSGQPCARSVVTNMRTLVRISSTRMGEIFISKVDRTTGPCVKAVRSTLTVFAKYYSIHFGLGQNMSEMEQKGWGGSAPQPGKKQGGGGVNSYPQAGSWIDDDSTWIDDDRITCNQCQHMAQAVQTINMQAQDFDRIRRANHPANQWMFDSVKIRNGWARVEYIGWQCNGCQPSYIPVDVKHRCHCYKPKQNAVEVNVKEWWE